VIQKEVLLEMQSSNKERNTYDENSSEVTYQQYIMALKKAIEFISILYLEFWAELKEFTPNIVKLKVVSTSIFKNQETIEQNWDHLVKMNAFIPSMAKFYSNF